MGKKVLFFIAFLFFIPIMFSIAYFWAIKSADAKFKSLTNGQEKYLNKFFTVENKAKGQNFSLLLKILTKSKKYVYLLHPLTDAVSDKKFVEAFEKVQNDLTTKEERQKSLQILLSMGITFNLQSEEEFLSNFNALQRLSIKFTGWDFPVCNYFAVLKSTNDYFSKMDEFKAHFLFLAGKSALLLPCKGATPCTDRVFIVNYLNHKEHFNNSTDDCNGLFHSLLYLNRTKLEQSQFYTFTHPFSVENLLYQIEGVKEPAFLKKMKSQLS